MVASFSALIYPSSLITITSCWWLVRNVGFEPHTGGRLLDGVCVWLWKCTRLRFTSECCTARCKGYVRALYATTMPPREAGWYGVDAARGCQWTNAHAWSYGDGDHEAEMGTFPALTLAEDSTVSCASTRTGSRFRLEILLEPFHSYSFLQRRRVT